MQKLILLCFLFVYSLQVSLQCNSKLVSSYGFNGNIFASREKMLFCPEVKYKCCTLLDELRFHKLWNTYYLQKLSKNFDKFREEYKILQLKLEEFKTLNYENIKKLIPEQSHEKSQILWNQIKEFPTEVFEKLNNELGAVQGLEQEAKQKFVCQLCDFSTHLALSNIDQKIYFSDFFCENIINKYRTYLKPKLLQLESTLVKIHELSNLLEIPDESFALDPIYFQSIVAISEQAQQCLSSSFILSKCRNICSHFSLSDFSEIFVSNIKLYSLSAKRMEILKKFLKTLEEFQKQQNQEGAKKELKEMKPCKSGDLVCEKKKQELEILAEGKKPKIEQKIEQKEGEAIKSLLKQRRILYPQIPQNKLILDETYSPKQNYHFPVKRGKMSLDMRRLGTTLNYIPVAIPNYDQQRVEKNAEEKYFLKEKIRTMKKKLQQVNRLKRELEEQKKEEKKIKEFKMEDFETLQKKIVDDLKKEFKQKLYLDEKQKIYLKFYEGIKKGSPNEFDNLGWLKNSFFDGDFLDNFGLGFLTTSNSAQYQIGDSFQFPQQKIVELVGEIWKSPIPSFELQPSSNSTYNVVEFVNQYVETDIADFNMDIKSVVGRNRLGDVPDYEEIKKKLEAEILERLKKGKTVSKTDKKTKEEKKPEENKSGENQPETKTEENKKAEEVQVEEKRKLYLKKIKNKMKELKNRLKKVQKYFQLNQSKEELEKQGIQK